MTDGADTAFENGTTSAGRTVYLPWKGYNERTGDECVTLTNSEQSHAQGVVSKYHGAWERCSRGARALHGRNQAIIHGLGHAAADRRVDAVICWTPGGATQGGTATGMKMARTAGIPVLNLARVSAADALVTMHTIARKMCITALVRTRSGSPSAPTALVRSYENGQTAREAYPGSKAAAELEALEKWITDHHGRTKK